MKDKDNYYEHVYEVTKQIPKGRVTTYGAIADYLGLGSARMVGWALKQSTLHGIPAHRVVNSKGELSGRHQFSHPDMMATLLQEEAVKVIDDKVVNFKQHFWHPAEGLEY